MFVKILLIIILAITSNFSFQINYFLSRFGHLPAALKSKLFLNFYHSVYGSQLWNLNGKEVSHFEAIWRKPVRRVWCLPARTHTAFISFLMNNRSFSTTIYCTTVLFILLV